jgi:hypothetical protein
MATRIRKTCNPRQQSLARRQQFWDQVALSWPPSAALAAMGIANLLPKAMTVLSGVPAFFRPNALVLLGVHVERGMEKVSYY